MKGVFKLFIFTSVLITLFFFTFYFLRWEYRNKEGLIGNSVNTFFNLNRLKVQSNNRSLKIVLKNEINNNGRILFDNNLYKEKVALCYGINSFYVYLNNQIIDTFTFFNKDKKNSFDFYFSLKSDSVSFKIHPFQSFVRK